MLNPFEFVELINDTDSLSSCASSNSDNDIIFFNMHLGHARKWNQNLALELKIVKSQHSLLLRQLAEFEQLQHDYEILFSDNILKETEIRRLKDDIFLLDVQLQEDHHVTEQRHDVAGIADLADKFQGAEKSFPSKFADYKDKGDDLRLEELEEDPISAADVQMQDDHLDPGSSTLEERPDDQPLENSDLPQASKDEPHAHVTLQRKAYLSSTEKLTLKTMKKTPVRRVLSLARHLRTSKSCNAVSHRQACQENPNDNLQDHMSTSSSGTRRQKTKSTKPPSYKGTAKELENLLTDSLI